MDSALRPRDIQARIRAGESVDEVARVAGVPVEKIEPFAGPVLAERQHVSGLALSSPVRRRGETTSNRQLRSATTEAFVAHGIDTDEVSWDAVLLGARRWQVTATYTRGATTHEAIFVYDLTGRFSVAGNDDARWLIGETTARAEAPAAPRAAVGDDELALVRAVQPDADELDGEITDAYSDTELAEVDGVMDIVVAEDPEMDALYDMLASFDEDSVKIYTGLVSPVESTGPIVAHEATATRPSAPEDARVEAVFPRPTTTPKAVPEPVEPELPEQPTLDGAEVAPKPAKASKKGRRATVPTWDEIMFGSPRQGPDKR